MPRSATQVCLNVPQCIICINESNISVVYTGVLRQGPGHGPE